MRILIPTLLFFFVCRSASGMIVETGNTVVIDRPVHEDIYLAGGTVTVNAPVYGDIVAAGGTIYINDTVYNEVLVAGANVTINGYVAGKVRCIGGTLHIAQNINGDLVIAGGTLSLEHNAVVSGSLLATGGNLIVNGKVRHDIRAACGSLRIYDTVGGDLDFRGTGLEIDAPITGTSTIAATRRLDIGTGAAFYGDVHYWTPGTADFGPSLKNGKATRDESLKPPAGRWYYLGAITVWTTFWYLGMTFAEILLLQLLLGALLKKAAASAFNTTLRSMSAGFLFVFGTPVLIVLLCFTAIGIPIAAVILLGYISAWIFCSGLVAAVTANWLNQRQNNTWSYWKLASAALGCAILLRLLFFIPFTGWIIFALLTLLAFGSILVNLKWKKRSPTL